MKMRNQIYFMLMILILLSGCDWQKKAYKMFKNGDIIFQTSQSRQSKALELATKSKYTHMGILYKNKGKIYVYEAVQPVKITPLETWVKRGKNQHFVVKRLKNAKKNLTPKVLAKMREYGAQFRGKNYDNYFGWDDTRIYCSELVWKIYKHATGIEIGELKKLKDFDLSHPIVRAKLKERYGKKIPLNETVISPQAMYESKKLKEIFRYKN